MTVWAILPSYERPNELVKTIQLLVDQELIEKLLIVVLDASINNHSDRMVKLNFSSNSNVLYQKINSNYLWSKSVNHGFTTIKSLIRPEDHVLIMNDDINFPKNALQKMLDTVKNRFGICTALEFSEGDLDVCIPHVSLKRLRVTSMNKSFQSEFQTFELDVCNSRFTLYPGWFIMQGNRFPIFLSPHHYADLKFSLQARQSGLQITGVPLKGYYSTVEPSVHRYVRSKWSYFFDQKSPGFFPASLSFWLQYIFLKINQHNLIKRWATHTKS
jgi:hypothetical protein